MMRAAGVPVTLGSDGPVETVHAALSAAHQVGYPVLLKASAGGGGRGIRRCGNDEQLESAYQQAKAEAMACFGNDELYLEKLVLVPGPSRCRCSRTGSAMPCTWATATALSSAATRS